MKEPRRYAYATYKVFYEYLTGERHVNPTLEFLFSKLKITVWSNSPLGRAFSVEFEGEPGCIHRIFLTQTNTDTDYYICWFETDEGSDCWFCGKDKLDALLGRVVLCSCGDKGVKFPVLPPTEPAKSNAAVDSPAHYVEGRKFEPRKVIEDWELDYYLGNAVKYISRSGRKNNAVEDLEKAKKYLDFEIEKLKKSDPRWG